MPSLLFDQYRYTISDIKLINPPLTSFPHRKPIFLIEIVKVTGNDDKKLKSAVANYHGNQVVWSEQVLYNVTAESAITFKIRMKKAKLNEIGSLIGESTNTVSDLLFMQTSYEICKVPINKGSQLRFTITEDRFKDLLDKTKRQSEDIWFTPDVSWSTFLTYFDLVKTAVDSISSLHPYGQQVWSILSIVPDILQMHIDRNSNVQELFERLADIYIYINEANRLSALTDTQSDKLKLLIDKTGKCIEFIREYTGNWAPTNVVKGPIYDKRISEFKESFDQIFKTIEHSLILQIGIATLSTGDFELLKDIPYADKAGFNNSKMCLPGTCEKLIEEIVKWINQEDTSKRVLILSGRAGAGKSAVAHTIAKKLGDQLGSFFCFDRGDKGRINSLFSTISRDLADHNVWWRRNLVQAIAKTAIRRSIDPITQFDEMIVKPFSGIPVEMKSRLVIIIDALDEAGDQTERKILLKLLFERSSELPKNYRIIITSRPEDDIAQFHQHSNVFCKNMPDSPYRREITGPSVMFSATEISTGTSAISSVTHVAFSSTESPYNQTTANITEDQTSLNFIRGDDTDAQIITSSVGTKTTDGITTTVVESSGSKKLCHSTVKIIAQESESTGGIIKEFTPGDNQHYPVFKISTPRQNLITPSEGSIETAITLSPSNTNLTRTLMRPVNGAENVEPVLSGSGETGHTLNQSSLQPGYPSTHEDHARTNDVQTTIDTICSRRDFTSIVDEVPNINIEINNDLSFKSHNDKSAMAIDFRSDDNDSATRLFQSGSKITPASISITSTVEDFSIDHHLHSVHMDSRLGASTDREENHIIFPTPSRRNSMTSSEGSIETNGTLRPSDINPFRTEMRTANGAGNVETALSDSKDKEGLDLTQSSTPSHLTLPAHEDEEQTNIVQTSPTFGEVPDIDIESKSDSSVEFHDDVSALTINVQTVADAGHTDGTSRPFSFYSTHEYEEQSNLNIVQNFADVGYSRRDFTPTFDEVPNIDIDSESDQSVEFHDDESALTIDVQTVAYAGDIDGTSRPFSFYSADDQTVNLFTPTEEEDSASTIFHSGSEPESTPASRTMTSTVEDFHSLSEGDTYMSSPASRYSGYITERPLGTSLETSRPISTPTTTTLSNKQRSIETNTEKYSNQTTTTQEVSMSYARSDSPGNSTWGRFDYSAMFGIQSSYNNTNSARKNPLTLRPS